MHADKSRCKKIEQLLKDAWSVRREGQYDEGKAILEEAKSLCKETDFKYNGRILAIYAQYDRDNGQLESALDRSRKSRDLYQASGDQLLVAHSVRHIADILSSLGNTLKALENYGEALEIYRLHPECDKQSLANTLRPYGLLLLKMKDDKMAKAFLLEAKALYEETGTPAGVEEMQSVIDSID